MTFAVVAGGTFLCYKYASQQMIKQGRGGRIISASSLSGKQCEDVIGSVNRNQQICAYRVNKCILVLQNQVCH
jgi:NAD(P)-dependent dehydrogenase (short-subunit alcohol dehydrogenase family)